MCIGCALLSRSFFFPSLVSFNSLYIVNGGGDDDEGEPTIKVIRVFNRGCARMVTSLNVQQSNCHQFRIRKEMRRLWLAWAVIFSCGLSGELINRFSLCLAFKNVFFSEFVE